MTDLIISVYERTGTGHQDPHNVGDGPLVPGTVHRVGPQVETDVVLRHLQLLAQPLPRGGDPLHHRDLVATSSQQQQVRLQVREDQDGSLHTAGSEVSSARCPASLQ